MDQNIIAPVRVKERKKKKDIWKIVSWIFILLFLSSVSLYGGYWYGNNYKDIKEQRAINLNNTVFSIGANYGYEQALLQIVKVAAQCKEVPITLYNETINLIAVECLQGTNYGS